MGLTTRKTHSQFMEEVQKAHGTDFDILDHYKNNKTKLRAIHRICGNEITINPKDFIKAKFGCKMCARDLQRNKPRLTNIQFTEKFYADPGRIEYELLSKYSTSREKVKVRHKTCGTIFYATANSLLTQKSGCAHCKNSKGELKIRQFLEQRGLVFKKEATLPGCSHKAALRFDFLVESRTGLVAVEFDGEQHFIAKPIFGGEEGLSLTKKRDRIKDKYCDEKGIRLIRIPYYHYEKIDEILSENLIRQEAS